MLSSSVVFLVATVVISTLALDVGESFLDLLISEEEYTDAAKSLTRFARQVQTTTATGSPTAKAVGIQQRTLFCCKSAGSEMAYMFIDRQVEQDCKDEFSKKVNGSDYLDSINGSLSSKENIRQMQFACVFECIGRTLKLLRDDGKADNEITGKFLETKVLTVDWMKPIADRIIDKCLRSLNDTVLSTPDTGDLKCNPSAIMLFTCLIYEAEINCPEADRRNDSYCTGRQAALDKIRTNSTN
uniref:Odorant binding protein 4 n=1 Tax=Subpsaltria yangi TaxID=1195109 RepID=A0A385IUP6_9HEMI|nr:odorant binding protein 4 [Subpsaltria yangi]